MCGNHLNRMQRVGKRPKDRNEKKMREWHIMRTHTHITLRPRANRKINETAVFTKSNQHAWLGITFFSSIFLSIWSKWFGFGRTREDLKSCRKRANASSSACNNTARLQLSLGTVCVCVWECLFVRMCASADWKKESEKPTYLLSSCLRFT